MEQDDMKQKVFMTGATGFLGKNLLSHLRGGGEYEILATAGHEDDNLGIRSLDLTDEKAVYKEVTSFAPDIVCHVGALVDLSRNFEVARKTAEVNIIGTTHLLLALKDRPAKKFIFASTEEVYGQGVIPYRENAITYPPSPYAATKRTCEHLLRLYKDSAYAGCYVFRIGTMYGPYLPDHRLISQIIKKALRNEEIPLTSGTKKRDYVFVGDVVDAIARAMSREKPVGYEIINIGGGEPITLQELADRIVQLIGSSSVLRLGAIPDRIGESDEWLLDNQKAATILGWKPETSIKNGLVKTIEFYKTH